MKEKNKVPWPLKPLQWLYCLYAMFWFVLIMLLIFPLAFAASFMGRIRGGNIIYRLCMFWADCWFFLVGIRSRTIYEQPYDPARSCIFVCNHTSNLDAAIIMKAFRKPLRPLGKEEMARIPIFGFIYRKAIVTVNRNSAENRSKSLVILLSILRKGISILVFPEGTFNDTGKPLKEFYRGAFRLALETKTPVRPVLYLDAYDRMHPSGLFTLTPGRCRIVYLEEIAIEPFLPNRINELKDTVYKLMEEKLIAYQAGWINAEFTSANTTKGILSPGTKAIED